MVKGNLEGLIIGLRLGIIMKLILKGTRWDGVDFISWYENGFHWWGVRLSVLMTSFIDIITVRERSRLASVHMKRERLDFPVLMILTDHICYPGGS